MFAGDALPDEETMKLIATARAILIQGLGDRPLRLCLSEKENPYRMWLRLRDRYAVSNTATRVQLQSKLSRMSYEGQSMPDFIDTYEEIFNRLAAMDSEISEDMQIAMLLASFGDKTKSAYGHVVASLQSVQESLSWETVTARLLQEYEERVSRTTVENVSKTQEPGTALAANRGRGGASYRKQKGSKQFRMKSETRRCFRCNQIGHIAKDCKARKKDRTKAHRAEEYVQYSDQDDGNAHSAQLWYSVVEENGDVSRADAERTNLEYDSTPIQEPKNVKCLTCFNVGHSYEQCIRPKLDCATAQKKCVSGEDSFVLAAVATFEAEKDSSVVN